MCEKCDNFVHFRAPRGLPGPTNRAVSHHLHPGCSLGARFTPRVRRFWHIFASFSRPGGALGASFFIGPPQGTVPGRALGLVPRVHRAVAGAGASPHFGAVSALLKRNALGLANVKTGSTLAITFASNSPRGPISAHHEVDPRSACRGHSSPFWGNFRRSLAFLAISQSTPRNPQFSNERRQFPGQSADCRPPIECGRNSATLCRMISTLAP